METGGGRFPAELGLPKSVPARPCHGLDHARHSPPFGEPCPGALRPRGPDQKATARASRGGGRRNRARRGRLPGRSPGGRGRRCGRHGRLRGSASGRDRDACAGPPPLRRVRPDDRDQARAPRPASRLVGGRLTDDGGQADRARQRAAARSARRHRRDGEPLPRAPHDHLRPRARGLLAKRRRPIRPRRPNAGAPSRDPALSRATSSTPPEAAGTSAFRPAPTTRRSPSTRSATWRESAAEPW